MLFFCVCFCFFLLTIWHHLSYLSEFMSKARQFNGTKMLETVKEKKRIFLDRETNREINYFTKSPFQVQNTSHDLVFQQIFWFRFAPIWFFILWTKNDNWMHNGRTLTGLFLFPPQASLQGVHRPAVPGPLATGELATAAHPRTGDPELSDPLQPHLTWLRHSGAVRGRHGPAELSDRGHQGHGQNVPQQQPQQSLGQRHERRRQRREAQKVTLRGPSAAPRAEGGLWGQTPPPKPSNINIINTYWFKLNVLLPVFCAFSFFSCHTFGFKEEEKKKHDVKSFFFQPPEPCKSYFLKKESDKNINNGLGGRGKGGVSTASVMRTFYVPPHPPLPPCFYELQPMDWKSSEPSHLISNDAQFHDCDAKHAKLKKEDEFLSVLWIMNLKNKREIPLSSTSLQL